nr:hypothetical protein [Tanacetum cinerariifolium]
MGTLENGRRMPMKLLKCIKKDDDIAKIDWCGYILDCLCNSKVNWKNVKNKNTFYSGPLTFLCLLYLDSTFFPDLNIIRHRPAIRSWNTMMIRKRINMETRQKCLGSLKHHGDFNPEEEQNIDLYKGLDIYIEPLSDRIPVTREERSNLVRTLRDRVTKFENNQMMTEFCKQYGELFNDNEFNVSESSMDDYKDSDSDANDNNKKNDDERATMADGNKKTENENEKKTGIKRRKAEMTMVHEQKKVGQKQKTIGMIILKTRMGVKQKTMEDEVSMNIDILNEEIKQKEVGKEKEIQEEHNRLTQDQFWDKEYDLTDKQYEELEIQATKDIKKKKTNKRKSIVDMTSPSFSLGKTTRDEVTMTEYLFSMEGEELDFVFETKDGAATIMDYMQTLAPRLKVEFNVIDTFSLILNHEQKMNSYGNKIKYFFHTTMIVKMFNWKKENGEYDEDKQFKAFSKIITSEFKKDPEMKNMKHLEMKKLFFMHLEKVEHPRAKDVLNKKPTIVRPK